MTDRKEHPHAWVLREIADGAPLSDFEIALMTEDHFSKMTHTYFVTFPSDWKVRRKVKMHRIGDHTFPAPMTEPPMRGSEYWVATVQGLAEHMIWDGYAIEVAFLNFGVLHSTREAAEAHGKALAAIVRGEPI